MQVDNISGNTFNGRILFDKKLTKEIVEYANRLFDTTVDNKTLRQKIASKTYDLTFFTTSSKKAIHPKLNFHAMFKTLDSPKTNYYGTFVRIDDNIDKNAEKISKFMDGVDKYKQNYNGYNTLFEKFIVWLRRPLEIFK